MKTASALACLGLAGLAPVAWAQGRAALAREAAEFVAQKLGAKVATKGVAALATKIEASAARYGPEAFAAVRKVGPRAMELAEKAGEHGAKAVRVMALHGEAGVASVLARPKAMAQYLRLGEDAAAQMVRHPGVAEKVLEAGGARAVNALAKVGPQGGRRLAMMLEGELAGHAAHHPALMDVIAKHGQAACDFCWANKGTLAGGAALGAFVLNPGPFLDGSAKLVGAAGQGVAGVAAAAGDAVVKPVVGGAFGSLNWVIFGAVVAVVAVAALIARHGVPTPEAIRQARDALRGK